MASPEFEGRSRAERYRQDNDLGTGPLGDLVALIDDLEDIDVALIPDVNGNAHGISMCDPVTETVIIAAACTQHPMRQRSTIAHELGHVLFQDHSDPSVAGWDARSAAEMRADAFARHLLAPVAGLDKALQRSDRAVGEETLSMLVQRFLASPQMIAIQLANEHHIDDLTKRRFMTLSAPSLAARYGWKEQYDALSQQSQSHRSPQRLLARLTSAYELGVVSLAALARVRRMAEDRLARELTGNGIFPPIEGPVVWSDPSSLLTRDPVDDRELNALFGVEGSNPDAPNARE